MYKLNNDLKSKVRKQENEIIGLKNEIERLKAMGCLTDVDKESLKHVKEFCTQMLKESVFSLVD